MKKCGNKSHDKQVDMSSFGRDKNQPDGLNRWCKLCVNKSSAERRRKPLTREKILAQQRTYDLKRPNRRHDPVRGPKIRESAKRSASKRRADPIKRAKTEEQCRESELKAYGLTLDTFSAVSLAQMGKCAICHTGDTGGKSKYLFCDHTHVPGYENLSFKQKLSHFRGLLCNGCNTGLGQVADSINTLRRLHAYLISPPAVMILADIRLVHGVPIRPLRYVGSKRGGIQNPHYPIWQRYKITIEEKQELSRRQLGKCIGCDIDCNDLHVDHSHDTKAVRGLLCFNCNLALGCFGDSVEVILSAIEYLELNKTASN